MIKTQKIDYGKVKYTIKKHFFSFLKFFIFLRKNVESEKGKINFF